MSETANEILQAAIPDGQADRAAARLPSMAPVTGPWLTTDDAYGAQMAERRKLIAEKPQAVYAQRPEGVAAARAFLRDVLAALPDGFDVSDARVRCPDGARIAVDWDAPLHSVGQIIQQDVCILKRHGDEHVLTGAILCFPASWTLAEKIGRPLVRIHRPVPEYNANIASRVQRLFDGVQRGRPMWRANHLRYRDPALFQPKPEDDPRPVGKPTDPYLRSERQTVLRLDHPDAVAFVIHTTVVRDDLEHQKDHQSGNP